ncbi:hypothetical protein B0I35DRAFT_409501 [Stachybotrys elegans]|uniref:Uncharacterized protein n=1 Tax=Stachybotrys elegans TaxID=80388 RepID=A0A8K0SPH0_9HYPO|nr:hypothetical protein B0I35DRAFT_409501 [Stachybotrys elegans]
MCGNHTHDSGSGHKEEKEGVPESAGPSITPTAKTPRQRSRKTLKEGKKGLPTPATDNKRRDYGDLALFTGALTPRTTGFEPQESLADDRDENKDDSDDDYPVVADIDECDDCSVHELEEEEEDNLLFGLADAIPFGLEDDAPLPDEDDAEEDGEGIEEGAQRPSKRPRLEPDVTADEWIAAFNEKYPVPDEDADMQQFRHGMTAIIERLCNWSFVNSDSSPWFLLGQEDREVTRGFRHLLSRSRPEELTDHILSHMPKRAQKVLGRKNLKPFNLLELPEIPKEIKHRLVYLDIPVQVGEQNITRRPSKLVNRHDSTKHSLVDADQNMDARVYIGSSINRLGAKERLAVHEKEMGKLTGKQMLRNGSLSYSRDY